VVVAKDTKELAHKEPVPGSLGKHVVAEFLGCNVARLEEVSFLKEQAARACELAGATVLSIHGHKFYPQGATAIVLLAESHLSIHTWPEYGYAAVDVYTCGPALTPEKAVEYLAERLEAEKQAVMVIKRGRHMRTKDGAIRFLPQTLACAAASNAGEELAPVVSRPPSGNGRRAKSCRTRVTPVPVGPSHAPGLEFTRNSSGGGLDVRNTKR